MSNSYCPSLENFLLKTGVLGEDTLRRTREACDDEDEYRIHLVFILYDVVSPKEREALRRRISLYAACHGDV
jgi:hypothetical protein